MDFAMMVYSVGFNSFIAALLSLARSKGGVCPRQIFETGVEFLSSRVTCCNFLLPLLVSAILSLPSQSQVTFVASIARVATYEKKRANETKSGKKRDLAQQSAENWNNMVCTRRPFLQ